MKKQKKVINIYFILAGENLFHPHFLKGVLKQLDKNDFDVVGISVAKDKYPKGYLDFIGKMFRLWGIFGFISMGALSVLRSIMDEVFENELQLKSIARVNNIPYSEVVNVNNPEHIHYLKQKNIDIIVSSNGQFFKKDLLELPNIACINRHSALLPKYGGVLPVFWAMFHKEKKFGVTIHYMVKEIDEGGVISQMEIVSSKNKSLFSNYIKAFLVSIDVTVDAIKKISKENNNEKLQKEKVSYFSFPTNSQLSKFSKDHAAFSLNDIPNYFKFLW